MENWEAAYVAGIIDGEGSITLTRMHEKEFRRPGISFFPFLIAKIAKLLIIT